MATFDRRPSSVIKKLIGNEGEWSIDEVTVLVDADTVIGDVLYNNSGTWTRVNAANTGNAAGVLVDDNLRFTIPAAGNHTLKVLRRGAVVDRQYLEYASDVDQPTEVTAAETALLTQGIKVVTGE